MLPTGGRAARRNTERLRLNAVRVVRPADPDSVSEKTRTGFVKTQINPRLATASRSSLSSATVASILDWLNSFTGSP